jgi:hypothetical protein
MGCKVNLVAAPVATCAACRLVRFEPVMGGKIDY